MWMTPFLSLLLVLAVANSTKLSRSTLEEDHGYKNVVVGISPLLKETQAQNIIAAIKKGMTEASQALFTATQRKLYFKNIKILIPKAWSNTTIDKAAQTERFEASDIRVDNLNPVYGHQPYTVQPGGCGEPGLYIHLTPDYLMNDTIYNLWGPRGKVLTRQWAQLRFGVFDELGYPNDNFYPTYYFEQVPGNNGKPRPDLRPTTCTDKTPTGRWIHRVSGNTCSPNGQDVINNKNCIFIPDTNQTLTSSLMTSYAYINMVEEFCDASSTRRHNKLAPTRQNALCNGQSVWEVIKKHQDFNISFDEIPALPVNANVTPEFIVVRELEASYALVLDYSGSMDSFNRFARMQRSAQRWILHEVATGSLVGIVPFAGAATVLANLTEIKNESSREDLANKITRSFSGSTCIGCGLQKAVREVLVGKQNKVIILISDGEENAGTINIGSVMAEVVNAGVRAVSIAYGPNAEKKMEDLAENTGGKSYIVYDDDDGTLADAAFEGSLTYQPGNTITNTNVKIYENEYEGIKTSANGTFVVDDTLGRNLKFRVDVIGTSQVQSSPVLTSPNGKISYNGTFDSTINLWTINVDFAENGTWAWRVTLSQTVNTSIRVSVSAQAKSETTLPILTEAHMNVGSQTVNATHMPVIIYAKVTQGNMPVVGAQVRAYVTQPDNTNAAIEVELLDNGQGADIQRGDGIYSRYFTNFSAPGRYAVKAQVWDDGNSYVNNGPGFIASRRQEQLLYGAQVSSRVNPLASTRLTSSQLLNVPDYCCGSVVPFDQSTATATGEFTRTTVAGSIQVSAVPQKGQDLLPPFPVRDLLVSVSEDLNQLFLTWTATGDDQDTGIVSGYEIGMSSDLSQLLGNFSSTLLLDFVDTSNMTELLIEAGTNVSSSLNLSVPIEIENQYFVALRAIDDVNQTSALSNIASLLVQKTENITTTEITTTVSDTTTTQVTPTADTNDTWGRPWIMAIIIVGCITGGFITLFIIMYAIILIKRECCGAPKQSAI